MAIFSHKCPYCVTDNTAFTVKFQDPIFNAKGIFDNRYELFATCNKCGKAIVSEVNVQFQLHQSPNPAVFNFLRNGELVSDGTQKIGEWLPKPDPIDVPNHLPDDVAKPFSEGCKVIGISNDGACSMFRKAIDIATKDLSKDSDGTPWKLEKRIDKLSKDGKITKDIAEWAHQIRIDGNEVLHENNASKEDAESLRDLTKYVLTYLYTLPEQVRIAREKSSKAASQT